MSVSDEFLEYLHDLFSIWGFVTARKMFGGAGLYKDGTIFALVADDILYLKVDETNRNKYLQAGSSPFQPFADKTAMMSYYEIPPEIQEDREELVAWAEQALVISKKLKTHAH